MDIYDIRTDSMLNRMQQSIQELQDRVDALEVYNERLVDYLIAFAI